MTSPVRIQRKRSKGWTLPPNTVCVGRPSKWGNPLTIGFGRAMLTGPVTSDWEDRAALVAVREFRRLLEQGKLRFTVNDVRRELRGKNLACWCPIGSPCHADVLLAIANSEEP